MIWPVLVRPLAFQAGSAEGPDKPLQVPPRYAPVILSSWASIAQFRPGPASLPPSVVLPGSCGPCCHPSTTSAASSPLSGQSPPSPPSHPPPISSTTSWWLAVGLAGCQSFHLGGVSLDKAPELLPESRITFIVLRAQARILFMANGARMGEEADQRRGTVSPIRRICDLSSRPHSGPKPRASKASMHRYD